MPKKQQQNNIHLILNEIICWYFEYFFVVYDQKFYPRNSVWILGNKKIKVGPRNVGSVGSPETQHFFLGLKHNNYVYIRDHCDRKNWLGLQLGRHWAMFLLMLIEKGGSATFLYFESTNLNENCDIASIKTHCGLELH